MNSVIHPTISTCITVIAFRRPQLLLDTLIALRSNFGVGAIPLYVYIDGAREGNEQEKEAVTHTVDVAQQFEWNGQKHVLPSTYNKGLQHGVRSAIDTSLEKHESTIIVEEDIMTSPFFLKFMIQGLNRYKDNEKVAAICGNVYPFKRSHCNPTSSFFLKHFACWGWATWRRSWENVCWDTHMLLQRLKNKALLRELNFGAGSQMSCLLEDQHANIIDAWDIQTNVSFLLQNQYCLYPPETLVQNTGWRINAENTHTRLQVNPNAPMAYHECIIPKNLPIKSSACVRYAISRMWYPHPFLQRIRRLIKTILFFMFPHLKKLRVKH